MNILYIYSYYAVLFIYVTFLVDILAQCYIYEKPNSLSANARMCSGPIKVIYGTLYHIFTFPDDFLVSLDIKSKMMVDMDRF